MDQNVTQLRAVGTAVVDGVKAAKDGFQLGDLVVAQQIASALMSAKDDIQVDEASALMEIGGQLLQEGAAMRRAAKGITAVE